MSMLLTPVNGEVWWRKEIRDAAGELKTVKLYDKEFNFICDFDTVEELIYFLKGVQK